MSDNKATSGFGQGFFGCFGVLAAVVLVGAAFLSLGQCSQTVDQPAAAPQSIDYANLENAGHCVEGLFDAAEAGQANGERSALIFPWRIQGEPVEVGVRLTCAVANEDREAIVVVDKLCADSDDEKCTRLVSFEQTEVPVKEP